MLHGDLLGERARLTPQATALVEVATGRRFTYQDLDRRACRCGRMLREVLGLEKGDRLGLLCGNRVEFLDVFFAAAKTGVILVPLNTHLAARELELIVRDSGMGVLIYDADLAATVAQLRERSVFERCIVVGGGADTGDAAYENLVQGPGEASFERTPCTPEDLLCLLYTSGTTGKPKGVMIPRRMVSWNGYNTVACWQLRGDDVSPIFTPLYHAGGLGAFLLPIFTVGGAVVLHAGFDPDEVWRVIEEERCTVVLGVPAIWKLLADASAFATTDLSHVRWFISGGAPLPPPLVERYRERGVVLRQGYGLTEVGVNCFAMTDADAWEHRGSVGKPLMFTEARVVGEDGTEIAAGEVGELCFRGPHVSSGYWSNSEATAEAYDGDGWFHTGDLAQCDAEGFFYIVGRRKQMFISGGVNIYPVEIESVLAEHPAVADAAVVGVPHPTWGEVGAAFVVLGAGATADSDRLRAFLAERIARYKIPKHFRIVDELPRTPYGKVLRRRLIESFNPEGEDG